MRSRISLVLLFCLCSLCYAKNVIVNPVPGTWANKQVLILDVPDNSEAFYSINGADPVVSGFAYDGPVLIDVTGNIDIRVVILGDKKSKNEYGVSYTVLDGNPASGNEEFERFLNTLSLDAPISYIPGTSIDMPSSIRYAVGDGEQRYLQGTSISFSADSVFNGYIPLYLTSDCSAVWRYVIYPQVTPGVLRQRSVPFSIENWEVLRFTDSRYIYCLDDGVWMPYTDVITLDRSVAHDLKWQSVDYNQANPILSYHIPAKPQLCQEMLPDGSMKLYFKNNADCTFESIDGFLSPGEHKTAVIDTFYGDDMQYTINLNVYSDHVLQGAMTFSCTLDKRPPRAPEIVASGNKTFSRQNMMVTVNSEDDAQLYYAVRSPVRLKSGYSIDEVSNHSLYALPLAENAFMELTIPSITLPAVEDSAVYYSILVYAEDAFGNKSEIVEQGYTIDSCNFYFDAAADALSANGTQEYPYVSFEQFQNEIGILKPTFVRMYIKGEINLPAGEFFPSYNCEIVGFDDKSTLLFQKNSLFVLRVGSMSLSSCAIKAPTHEGHTLFKLENGVLHMQDCSVYASFASDGVIFTSDSSIIDVRNSSIVAQAGAYASVFSSSNSRVVVLNANVSSVANAGISVAFSLQEGSLQLRDSVCKVVGKLGRVAELFGGETRLSHNDFVAELTDRSSAIWRDDTALVLENTANEIEGF
ncbi:MAG: hypothetical protein K6E51_14575 [Treponema sp.]|nr:hypothetical protein [Treponema sp.]